MINLNFAELATEERTALLRELALKLTPKECVVLLGECATELTPEEQTFLIREFKKKLTPEECVTLLAMLRRMRYGR